MDPPERPAADPRPRVPTREQYDEAAEVALGSLRHLPVLALAATLSALVELLIARVGWYGLSDLLDHGQLLELHRTARFPRNLAALTGMVALGIGFSGYLRFPGYAPVARRLAVASFAGIFVAAIAVATFTPGHYLRDRLVVFGLAAANVLVTLLAMSALRYRGGLTLRLALFAALLSSFCVLTVVGLVRLAEVDRGVWVPAAAFLARRPAGTTRFLLSVRHAGEIGWLSVLVFGALRVFAGVPEGAPRLRRWVPVAAVSLSAMAVLAYRALTGHLFRVMLYGAFRLDLLRDERPYLYAVPLGAGLAAGLYALFRRDPPIRQLGAGLLLWLCAGFGPHTLIQLLYLVLGVILMIRAAQAFDPAGTWRDRHPFLQWRVRLGP